MKTLDTFTNPAFPSSNQPIPAWPEEFSFLQDVDHSVISMKKGENVFTEGEGCGRLGFIISGTIKVFKDSPSGRSMTLYRIRRGESCMLSMSCALSNPIHQASAMVEEDAWVITLRPDIFRKLMNDSEEARNYVFTQFALRMTDNMVLIEEVVFKRMDQRLTDTLITRSHSGKDIIKMTHEELAIELGTAREVISRLLKELELSGLVRLQRGSIEIMDVKALSKKGA
ncbi:MAG: Crp/Fnr family transcriptional regulator [Ignavibacteria bacterium]